jgi:hypothetical protein
LWGRNRGKIMRDYLIYLFNAIFDSTFHPIKTLKKIEEQEIYIDKLILERNRLNKKIERLETELLIEISEK